MLPVEVKRELDVLSRKGRLQLEKECFQHGDTTVLEHSIKVAVLSLWLVKFLNIKVNRRALIRGALLHDYFLYDWHDKDHGHRPHGFTHPKTALKNAKQDFALSGIERNIILTHMFPMVPLPPKCREAWIVCMVDKYCATRETLRGFGVGR